MILPIEAKFDYVGMDEVAEPDSLADMTELTDTFVISRKKDGTILSVYGDKSWDLLPYTRVSLSCRALFFLSWIPNGYEDTPLANKLVEQLKRIMFCEIYMTDSFFSVTTLRGRFGLWVKLARNLLLQEKCFETANDNHHLTFIQNELKNYTSFAQMILPRVRFAQNFMPNDIAPFSLLSEHAYKVFQKAANQSLDVYKKEKSTQTTVIPSRIYSELIVNSDTYIKDFNKASDSLFAFLNACNENRAYGRKIRMQIDFIKDLTSRGKYPHEDKIPRDSRGFYWWQKFNHFEPDFIEASSAFKLNKYFDKYNIKGFNCIKKLLSDLQRAVVINIGIFTGARESEIAYLPMDCLSTIVLDGDEHVLISGLSSKMQQTITESEWIADLSTKEAVRAVKSLNQYILQCNEIDCDENEAPLFIRLLGINCLHGEQKLTSVEPNSSIYTLPISYSTKSANEFLDRFKSAFQIHEEDLTEVMNIDPHYGYLDNEKFNVGSVWPLSDHQVRRSLVVYAFNDGIDHPDLKWQLKHISLSMTLWYGRNGAFAKAITRSSDHIYKDYQDAISEYEATQYLANVISEEVKLHGTHGVFISNMIIKHGHDETRRLVSRGELTYKETPIGGCVSLSGCSMDAFINVTSCIPCKSSVFTTKDIPKIERAIVHIENIVNSSEENSQAYISSQLQITELNRLKHKVENDD